MNFGPEPVGETFDGENSLEEKKIRTGDPLTEGPAGIWAKKRKKKRKRKGPPLRRRKRFRAPG
jgi:hypothetical protein